MTENLLNPADLHARLEAVSGVTVAQRVGRTGCFDSRDPLGQSELLTDGADAFGLVRLTSRKQKTRGPFSAPIITQLIQ